MNRGEIKAKHKEVEMGYTPETKAEISHNVAEALDWRFAERNDEAVAPDHRRRLYGR